ncbi:uncharacterized protein LOC123531709 [Mercenaria mercenaria]|uniref:uncharacterized protein LOC123531709 n=1 Tax=Mercenaria mercenaria TaxID=6596 RepID=UPI00234F9550|nr:uncharacterized protein LOC123531709 [Mercenaria mercenaria]XP_053373319.1 uncharacterized protein LOC123531709 [Mercenaria mercenaria]
MNRNYTEWDRQFPHNLPEGLLGTPATGQVCFVPPSPQAKMAGQNGFIDLKKLKGPGSGANFQPSDDAQPIFAPGDLQVKQQLLFNSLKVSPNTRSRITPGIQGIIPQLSNLLPDPTFGHAEKQFLKKPTSHTAQPSKTFTEGPPLPLTVGEDADQFGVELRNNTSKAFGFEYNLKSDVSVPTSKYIEGTVKYTTKAALKEMVQDLARLDNTTTGCIVDETCAPECDTYDKDIHFLSEQCLGRGSYGTVDLCYDSKTQKPFVRKQLAKGALRTSEIIVPTTLNHHNITKFYGLIQRENANEGNPTMELLIEYGGEALNKYFQEGKTLSDPQIWDASKQGLAALVHISHYSIVHLDVKPENICIYFKNDGSLVLKLTDFGSSRLPQEPLRFVGLTPEYLASEICKMFLQSQNPGLDFGLTEADITGKVDTFAFGLVIMFMYKGYHILVKVINNGKTSYDGIDAQTRRLMHMNLMMLMAEDHSENSFVHSLIPDECDLDMRDLLTKLTEHRHQDRFSARQALDIIEGMEHKIKMSVRPEQKMRDATDQQQQLIQNQVPLIVDPDCQHGMGIPGIAEDCMESDNGPVKNRTKDALRMKLKPYGKKGKYCKDIYSKSFSPQSPITEMHELRQGIASKQMHMMPMTPVSEFQGLSLEQSLPKNLTEDTSSSVSMTERRAPIAQPSMDTSDHPSCVSHLSQPVQAFNAVRPSQTVEPAPGFTGQPVEQAIGFSGIIPTPHMGGASMEQGNVVSLGGKQGTQCTFGMQPSGVACLNIPQELIQKWLIKKVAACFKAEQAMVVKTEPKVYPEVINIGSSTPIPSEAPTPTPVVHTRNMKTFGDSPVKMEEGNDCGNMPKFSKFF